MTELTLADGSTLSGSFKLGACPFCRAVLVVEDEAAHQATHRAVGATSGWLRRHGGGDPPAAHHACDNNRGSLPRARRPNQLSNAARPAQERWTRPQAHTVRR